MFVAVFGANGMLGHDIVKALSDEGIPHLALGREQADIGNEINLFKIFKDFKITHAINCAAYTDVAKAEVDVDTAKQVNEMNVEVLAETCRRNEVALIHFSTDYVFDGIKRGAYKETDKICPVNMYGLSKSNGERKIYESMEDYKIFRLQWLYGSNGNSFINKILSVYKQKGLLNIVDDQYGSPSSTIFVSRMIMKVLYKWKDAESGIYHLAHEDHCSWYEFAKYIFKTFQREEVVHPISYKDFNSKVIRPENCVMDTSKIKTEFEIDTMGSWKHDFDDFLARNKNLWSMFQSIEHNKMAGVQ